MTLAVLRRNIEFCRPLELLKNAFQKKEVSNKCLFLCHRRTSLPVQVKPKEKECLAYGG